MAFRLYPEVPLRVTKSADIYARVTKAIEEAVRECLITRVDKSTGNPVDYLVRAEDGELTFKTKREAVECIAWAVSVPLLKAAFGVKGKKPFVPDDETYVDEAMTHTGVPTELDQDGTGVDAFGNKRRKTLLELHRESMAKRGRVNHAKREARIK